MNFEIYSGSFLAGHGYPIIIVTHPILEGNTKTSECHSFYSGKIESYSLNTLSYDSEDSEIIENLDFIDTVKQQGENFIYAYMEENSEIQYRAMLAGYIGKIEKAQENEIVQLHLRNFISSEIENRIIDSSANGELKKHMKSIARLNRVTTQRKI